MEEDIGAKGRKKEEEEGGAVRKNDREGRGGMRKRKGKEERTREEEGRT